MAKIKIEYDTVEKTVMAKQDGEDVEFTSFMLAKNYDNPEKYNMEMYSAEKDEENDMWHSYRCACEKYDKENIVDKIKKYLDTNTQK